MPKSFVRQGSSRRIHLLYGTTIGVLLAIGATEKVQAACTAAFTAGADNVGCSGASTAVDGLGGDDTIRLDGNFGPTAADIIGNSGNDTITLADGSNTGDFLGNDGNDVLQLAARWPHWLGWR